MTFDEILEQVITLLQRQKRVAYGALKRRFNLDDAYLEDLKDELIYARHVAIDEDNRVLVWTGTSSLLPETIPVSAQPPVPHADVPQVESLWAERRQLTVMFCDLADSTALASRLDPEDLREVVRAYQQTCAVVIQRFEGHIAQYLGDGLLVYFGYPQAHEDDALRAVHAGLEIVEAMRALNARLEQARGIRLAVRLGIHTGQVVVGEIGGGERHEQLALGETPNLAARLQGLAALDTVVISAATLHLVQGYVEYQELGVHTLKGITAPVTVYRILRPSVAQSRLDVASARGLTPFVGRESELALLLERWAQVKEGTGHVILVNGEAGIGKSRLVQVLKDRAAAETHTRLECRCSPYHQNSALYPLIDLLHRALSWQEHEAPADRLEKLEHALRQYRLALDETVPLLAALLSLPLPEGRYPQLILTPQRQKQQTLEVILTLVLELTERQPVLFIVEDLHWVDPSTLEFLGLLIEQGPTVRLLTLLTYRPTFQPPWLGRAHITPFTLTRLPAAQVEAMVARLTSGKPLPTEVLHHVVTKTDGVPLFVEELTKMLLESGLLTEADDRYGLAGPLPTLAIPTTLHDSLMARLDRLAAVKVVAQLGATLGRQFSYSLLQAVSPLDELTLQHGLQQLVDAELLYRRGVPPQATYLFKHALIQEAAYASLLKSTRQQYHQRTAQVLAERFPEATETQPELLAYHYTEAGFAEQSIPYWQQAGQRAVERSAHVEAIAHLSKGLALVKQLPDTPYRIQHELTLLITLGPALIAHKGQASAEVEHTYTRAYELCRHIDEPTQLFPVLRGLWIYYNTRGQFQTGHELGEQLYTLAQRTQDAGFLLEAHRTLGTTLFFLGDFDPALDHCMQNIACYDLERHRLLAVRSGQDPGVASFTYAAYILWLLGYPEQALERLHETLSLARKVPHIYSLSFALGWAAVLHHCLRQRDAVQEQAAEMMTLCTQHGLPLYLAFGTTLYGRVCAAHGQLALGIVQMRQGITQWRSMGAEIMRTYMLALLADAYREAGQMQEGVVVLTEAMSLVAEKGERWWEAELYRLKGELLLALSPNNEPDVEVCLRHALDIARRQQAKSLELRAATSLARLWQHQGKHIAARELLAPVYGWFTEGFDTADLRDARALLEELA
jgi:class 3 adenylate cyclase/predicted ATPase